jgi:sterol desaturase/sphingolipid hydroxylase (fatty acid hydroxylase superfamily)
MHAIYSIYIIISSFSLSAITTFIICYINNKPFINPNYNVEKRIERIKEMGKNMIILTFQSFGMIYVVSENIIPYREHSNIFESIFSMIQICFFIEANYYMYHRIIHKYYYTEVHKKHHENVIVYPFDTFFLTDVDDFAFMFSLLFPSTFIKISVIEQSLIIYIYITTSVISHSDIYWKHHYIHHKLPCYNYCLLFPIFDILFGTYKKETYKIE